MSFFYFWNRRKERDVFERNLNGFREEVERIERANNRTVIRITPKTFVSSVDVVLKAVQIRE